MPRVVFLLLFAMLLQLKVGVCGFTLEAPGFGVKRLVASGNNVLATDGMSMLLLSEQGEKLAYAKVDLDYSYLLQDAVQANGAYYFLYQHSGSPVRFALLALNADLSVRWLRDYEQAGATFGYALAAAPDGVVVAGRSCDPGFFLCNVNAAGDVVWHKTYASGNATALPGALVATQNGFAAAFKISIGGAWQLGMLNVDHDGNALQTTLTTVGGNLFIKALVETDNGFAALLHRAAGGINSIVAFDPSFFAQHRYDIVSTNPMQLTDMIERDGKFMVCGNALQNGGSDLDIVYGVVDPLALTTNISVNGTSAYDDARSLVKIEQQIWVGGNREANAFVGSFAATFTKPCAFSDLPANVSQSVATSQSVNGNVSVGPLFSVTTSQCSAAVEPLSIVNFCTVEETATSVENTPTSENFGFAIYPNPSNGNFSVASRSTDNYVINVFDVNGKRVMEQRAIPGVSTINLKQPVAGSYVVSMVNEQNGLVESRMIVVKP